MPPGTRILWRMTTATNAMTTPTINNIGFSPLSGPLSAYRDPCTSTVPLSVRLCTGVERVNSVGAATASSNIACGGTVGSPRHTCALGNGAVQRRRVLFWHATRMLKAVLATVWVSVALIAGIAGNLNSVTSWTILAGVAVIPPIVMMWRWNAPRQTMSESIQEARR